MTNPTDLQAFMLKHGEALYATIKTPEPVLVPAAHDSTSSTVSVLAQELVTKSTHEEVIEYLRLVLEADAEMDRRSE